MVLGLFLALALQDVESSAALASEVNGGNGTLAWKDLVKEREDTNKAKFDVNGLHTVAQENVVPKCKCKWVDPACVPSAGARTPIAPARWPRWANARRV